MSQDTDGPAKSQVLVGLLADPGLPYTMVNAMADRLPATLARLEPGYQWNVQTSAESLKLDEQDSVPLLAEARAIKETHGWDLLVYLTDLPRLVHTRPLIADVNSSMGAALVSLPAMGLVQHRRIRATVVDVVAKLHGATTTTAPLDRRQSRLAPLRGIETDNGIDSYYALLGWRGQTRLLLGLVRSNRPWRLLPALSGASAAAAATGAFGIFYTSIWALADVSSTLRLTTISVLAVIIMSGWLIAYNGLWEKPEGHHIRRRKTLYNVSTIATVTTAVACTYLLLFIILFAGAFLIIPDHYLQAVLTHPVTVLDYLNLAWLAASMGTIAGAVGSSFDGADRVRASTYSRRDSARKQQQARERPTIDDDAPPATSPVDDETPPEEVAERGAGDQ